MAALWLGGAPGVLFRTDDSGRTWETVQSLVAHESREKWNPGAGGMCCHSIQLDPDDPNRMYVAISAAGTFRTEDGGESWTPANTGVAADFFPDNPFPEVGQCVHKLLSTRPGRSASGSRTTAACTAPTTTAESGSGSRATGSRAASASRSCSTRRDPDTAFVIPEEGAENRVTPDGRLGVYRTHDGGQSWELARRAACRSRPGWPCSASLRRSTRAGVYFGTQSGSVFASADGGDSWVEAARTFRRSSRSRRPTGR